MAVTTLPSKPITLHKLIAILQNLLPDVQFAFGESFRWAPASKTIFYTEKLEATHSIWSLLHEAGHALREHGTYATDLELLMIEVEAWDAAKALAQKLGITIDSQHIEDCLDTYRDWLHSRSACPICTTTSLETVSGMYRCHNCYTSWRVSQERFCRTYRMKSV